MTVIGVGPEEFRPRPTFDRMAYPDRLDKVIPEADVLFFRAPTKDSEGMIGLAHFELMKGGYCIALSRGKVYSMDALVQALDNRRLAGSGFDVTDPEPLPAGPSLWKFEHAIITPHVATHGLLGTKLRIEAHEGEYRQFTRGE